MKKSLVIISFAFIFLLSMSIISANHRQDNQDGKIYFDDWLNNLWGKITGKAIAKSGPSSCVDSDGNDITNKGYVTITSSDSSSDSPPSISFTDSCASTSAVTEYTCSSSTASQATSASYPCQSGYSCNDGACKSTRVPSSPLQVNTCFDSDGNNITNKGNVTILGHPLYVDSCASTSAVTEYTCSSSTASQATSASYPCQSGYSCQNGVCFSSSSSCDSNIYDCDGNGIISGPSCSGIDPHADGSGVFVDFLSFNSLTNYTNLGNKTIQLAENYQGVEFDWDFSDEFNFCGVSLKTSDENDNFGYVVFNYSSGVVEDKTAFVDRINKSNIVCVKDSFVADISEISAKCNAPDEILINCPGNFTVNNPTYNYNCTITSDELQYQIWPLKHSAVKEMTGLVSAGTGMLSCVENWSCTDWSDAFNQCGTKTCVDLNDCGTMFDKPFEEQSCDIVGEAGGKFGAGSSELSERKGKSILFFILGIVGLILLILLSIYFVKRRNSEEELSENQTHNQTSPPRSPPASPQNRAVNNQSKYNQLAPQR